MSPEDYEACVNLKAIFHQAKRRNGITQKDISKVTGIDQPNISQHMNCKRPMSAGTVIKYAQFFGCYPGEIDQRLAHLSKDGGIERAPAEHVYWAPILTLEQAKADKGRSKDSGKFPLDRKQHSDQSFILIQNTTQLSPRVRPGDKLVCDPTIKPTTGKLCVYEIDGEWVAGYFETLGNQNYLQVPSFPPIPLDSHPFIASVALVLTLPEKAAH
ncbi:MAG: helix-turn-helix domain-containing protein [Gammaproteobacteria bacterium]|nr:helix-turn-helix domain-containing protein [Gammaproteobacteria bacterium]